LPLQLIWGAGGFTVQQYGSLRLKNLVIAAALAISTGGHATAMAMAVAAGEDILASADLPINYGIPVISAAACNSFPWVRHH
jgi:hypothetical protein